MGGLWFILFKVNILLCHSNCVTLIFWFTSLQYSSNAPLHVYFLVAPLYEWPLSLCVLNTAFLCSYFPYFQFSYFHHTPLVFMIPSIHLYINTIFTNTYQHLRPRGTLLVIIFMNTNHGWI